MPDAAMPHLADRRSDRLAAGRIDRPARHEDIVRLPDDWKPIFLVFVDTEEEFDWSALQSRDNVSTTHVPTIAGAQERLAAGGAIPLYLVDWPIAEDDRARELLGGFARTGSADIGLHLHPWVNPPFVEDAHGYNSFAGNLPAALERQKVEALRDFVAERFGLTPTTYRAGRYGVGPNTAAILERAGLRVDCSARSSFSYRAQGGPDFSGHGNTPWWCGPRRQLIEIPLGVAHLGILRHRTPGWLMRADDGALRGLASRLGVWSRVPLTPEGTSAAEAVRAIDHLVRIDTPVLSFSFHSPSLQPGHTPYVRDEAELRRFWQWWDAVFDRLAFHGIAGGRVADVVEAADRARDH